MAKKSFKDINNPAMNFISVQPEESQDEGIEENLNNTRDTQDVQEDEKKLNININNTQGKKGQKLPRINMAFSEDNLEYLQVISRINGVSITQYVNNLITTDKESKSDVVNQYKKFMEGIK